MGQCKYITIVYIIWNNYDAMKDPRNKKEDGGRLKEGICTPESNIFHWW
jgi:hypothetical protein